MKQIKTIFWLLILGFLGLVIYQNQELFLNKQSFGLNLYFTGEFKAPDLYNAIFLLASFLIGFLTSYFFSLFERYRSKKMIKSLNVSVDSHLRELSALRSEVETLKGGSAGDKEATAEDSNQPLDVNVVSSPK